MQTHTANTFVYYILRTIGFPLDRILHFLARRYHYFFWVVTRLPEMLFWIWGRFNFNRSFLQAKSNVPACFRQYRRNDRKGVLLPQALL